MSGGVPFVKTNGAGNDFILVDERVVPLDDPAAFARRTCDRERGIGADGLLLVGRSERGTVRMRIFNADGSEAEMCGNGMRCVARYLDERDGRGDVTVETLAGPVETRILDRNPYRVAVEMPPPRIGARRNLQGYDATEVDVGNPHLVIVLEREDDADLARDGARLASDPGYPDGTNVHFVHRDRESGGWQVRHWERGVGPTQACGTGAVAVAAVLIDTGLATSPVALHVPGGVLDVAWCTGGGATLTGDAVREFEQVAS